MPLSWNEIKNRALEFSKEWKDESSEDAEAKSFWDGFFNIFGVSRRRVASFERPVKKADGRDGYIDLLWKGVMLVEHKSRGKDLDRAFTQALDYFPGLKDRDLPRYVLVSDFARFRLYDLDTDEQHEFGLADLYRHVKRFGFIAGYQTRSFGSEDPVNIKAAELLGRLHDTLEDSGYTGHQLEVFLVRVLFCLFAEDTAIFERRHFQDYIEQRTAEDGSDLGMHLAMLFQTLDRPGETRLKNLDEQLAAFPYVNGRLFAEPLPIASFTRKMREALLDCCALDWSRISPAIFGSLFQSVMDKTERRNLGAHYTTETNILKAIRPLFLDSLEQELAACKGARQLEAFHDKLANTRVLDPACGCGNFLVIAYRELRRLELETLQRLHQHDQLALDAAALVRVDVDQFHGIEIEDFPAQIAQVALWLTDHQMNLRVSEAFGQYFARLPLKKSPHIVHGNALQLDWKDVVPPERLSYIVGNPPFIGKKEQNAEQKAEVMAIFGGVKGAGVLDYVSAWYRKAAEYMAYSPPSPLAGEGLGERGKTHSAATAQPAPATLSPTPLPSRERGLKAAFVSTNSITQGEQVGVLWPDLLARGVRIHFAHRTFQWSSEARGKAAVHCVIIGFGLQDVAEKWIYDYDTPKSEPHAIRAENINPYLVDGPNVVVEKRTRPLCVSPEMDFGSKAADFGHLTLSPEEMDRLLADHPGATAFVREFLGADEFLNGTKRYCLWLKGADVASLRSIPFIVDRLEKVRSARAQSVDANTRRWADMPALFQADRQPNDPYLLVPKVSSERRVYVPLGFCQPHLIVNPSVLVVPHATPYHFGVLQSAMHMAWLRAVGGRMKSDYQYSNTVVYNNFPWPECTLTPALSQGERGQRQRAAIEAAAQGVLDARALYLPSPSGRGAGGEGATLADLYDPLTMPPELVKAHQALDRAVDTAYGVRGFDSEAKRVAFLFERYQQLAAPLDQTADKPARKRRSKTLEASA